QKRENEAERAGCRDAVEWIIIDLMKSKKTGEELSSGPISLRLLPYGPPMFIIMSDKEAIVGHYIPYMPIESVRMIHLDGGSELYNDYKNSFLTFFALGTDPKPSIEKYQYRPHSVQDVKRWDAIYRYIPDGQCTNQKMLNLIERRQK